MFRIIPQKHGLGVSTLIRFEHSVRRLNLSQLPDIRSLLFSVAHSVLQQMLETLLAFGV